MILSPLFIASMSAFFVMICFAAFVRWGSRWGATPEEFAMRMPGDAYLDSGPVNRTSMTRAISINAPPEVVWPWLAQLGRGAGWYSIDWLDNGGKASARHIVSWIPDPQLGDATAIGYLRHLEIGKELVWWTCGGRFLGARTRSVADIKLSPQVQGSRLVIRWSADATGFTAPLAIWLFQFIDSIMSRKQLLGIKERVELYGVRTADPDQPETGSGDQYQQYEVIYAFGEKAGVPGKEEAEHWHQAAVDDSIIQKLEDNYHL